MKQWKLSGLMPFHHSEVQMEMKNFSSLISEWTQVASWNFVDNSMAYSREKKRLFAKEIVFIDHQVVELMNPQTCNTK